MNDNIVITYLIIASIGFLSIGVLVGYNIHTLFEAEVEIERLEGSHFFEFASGNVTIENHTVYWNITGGFDIEVMLEDTYVIFSRTHHFAQGGFLWGDNITVSEILSPALIKVTIDNRIDSIRLQ